MPISILGRKKVPLFDMLLICIKYGLILFIKY